MDTLETCKRIRTALRRRSGKAWSATRGRGTVACWIEITAPPSRRTQPYDYMTGADRTELGELLGLDAPVHNQGEHVSPDLHAEYVQRAESGVSR